MAIKFDKASAVQLLREEAQQAELDKIDPYWYEKIKKFSDLCSEGTAQTHVAFLGTSFLAKSLAPNVDLYAIKPKHSKNNEFAYSARTLCHSVLVPLAAELNIDIGVTGREPLNNQPYFRMNELGDDTPIHAGGRKAFNFMISIIGELATKQGSSEAQKALRAFLFVRKNLRPHLIIETSNTKINLISLPKVLEEFVVRNSEGGRRAQAIVAGLLDVCYGEERVFSGRINDPSRSQPGDICIRSSQNPLNYELAFEVRDKIVSLTDIHIFGNKCGKMGLSTCAMVAVAENQDEIDLESLSQWSLKSGVRVAVFHGWQEFIGQALFWARPPEGDLIKLLVKQIGSRLRAVEVAPATLLDWQKLNS